MPGLLVAAEGIDNLGKTTAVRAMAPRLEEAGYRVTLVEEFGRDAVGRAVRGLVRGAWSAVPAESQPLLIAADRLPRYRRAFRELADPRRIVLADRFLPTAVIYQALASGGRLAAMERRIKELYGDLFRPADLVLRFEAPVETAIRRGGSNVHDRGFLAAAAEAYRELDLGRAVVAVDAERSPQDVAAFCVAAVLARAEPIRPPAPVPATGPRGRV